MIEKLGCLLAFVIIVFIIIESYVFMMLFNWLTPLFWSNAPVLTFWQSLGILFFMNFIGNILFNKSSK